MKQFLSFVRKEFHHILRDRQTFFILLVMPLIQILIFGFALTNEVKNANFVVLDNAGDVASHQLITKIASSRYFSFAKNIYSYKDIEHVFQKDEARVAIIFPPSFASDLQHCRCCGPQHRNHANQLHGCHYSRLPKSINPK
jgi:ABC-2 type transport system permease protein